MEITLDEALAKDLKDKVIIFQTDTVYGVGCLYHSTQAIERIYRLKKREEKKPLVLLVGSFSEAVPLLKTPENLAPYAQRYWPGAVTFVSEKSALVPDEITRGLNTVGLRMPADAVALALLKHFGPMAVTSLNVSKAPAVLRYEDALKYADQVDYIVKGPNLKDQPSTVFDIDQRETLRQGQIIIQPVNVSK